MSDQGRGWWRQHPLLLGIVYTAPMLISIAVLGARSGGSKTSLYWGLGLFVMALGIGITATFWYYWRER